MSASRAKQEGTAYITVRNHWYSECGMRHLNPHPAAGDVSERPWARWTMGCTQSRWKWKCEQSTHDRMKFFHKKWTSECKAELSVAPKRKSTVVFAAPSCQRSPAALLPFSVKWFSEKELYLVSFKDLLFCAAVQHPILKALQDKYFLVHKELDWLYLTLLKKQIGDHDLHGDGGLGAEKGLLHHQCSLPNPFPEGFSRPTNSFRANSRGWFW